MPSAHPKHPLAIPASVPSSVPEQLQTIHEHVLAGRAPMHVLESAIADHVSRESMRRQAVEHAFALVEAMNETPGAPRATKKGARVVFPGDLGYLTVGHDGSLEGDAPTPGRRGQRITFSPEALRPVQRRAYRQALDRYYAGVMERGEDHAQERMALIDDLRGALGVQSALGVDDEAEAVERAAERAAWQAAHEEGRGNPDQVVEAYHGGSAPIRKFDPSKVVDNSFWFSEDKDKILRGESGAASVKWLMTVRLRVSKTAGWDEYDRYFLTQLQDMGYDSVHLDDDWIIFDPERIEVVRVERVTARKNPRVMRRAADPGDWVEIEDAAYDAHADDARDVDDWVTIEECACSSCAPMRLNPRAQKRKASGAYAELEDIVPVIAGALSKHGLTMSGIEEVKFTRGGKSRAGSCAYSRILNKCKITFNGLAWPAFTEEQRLNTILHEAAHAIQFLTTGRSNHGPEWQKIARSIGCTGDRCMSVEASQAMVDAYAEAKGLPKRKIITPEAAMAASGEFSVGDYVSFEHKGERWYGKIVGKDDARARVSIMEPRAGITGKIPYPELQKEAPRREKVTGVDKPAPGESVAAWQARTGREVRRNDGVSTRSRATEQDENYARSFAQEGASRRELLKRIEEDPSTVTWFVDSQYPVENLKSVFKGKANAVSWIREEERAREQDFGDDYYDRMRSWLRGDVEDQIVVLEDSTGKAIDIWDGWHRSAISIDQGRETLPAIVGVVSQKRRAHRRNPSVPPGFSTSFTGFDFFDDVPEEDTPSLSETRQTLRSMKRGDVVAVGRTQWAVMRVLGDLQALVYKHPSKHTKLYELRLEGDDDVVVFEVGGSGQRVSEDVASGPLRATGETVDL